MNINNSIKSLLLSALLSLSLICGCSTEDKPAPDKGNSGLDMAADSSGGTDGSITDGPITDGPVRDAPVHDSPGMNEEAAPDTMQPDLPPASSYKVVVTEIMANPSAVSDGDGEWLELHNAGSTAVDISGWTLKDEGSDSHVIKAGGGDAGVSLTIAPGQYVVLAKKASSAINGGVTVFYTYDHYFLANGGDEIVLLDESGKLVDRITYSNSWKIPAAASIQLKDLALDNNLSSSWCVSTTKWTGSAGDSGTPGAANACVAATDGGADTGTGPDAAVTDAATDSVTQTLDAKATPDAATDSAAPDVTATPDSAPTPDAASAG